MKPITRITIALFCILSIFALVLSYTSLQTTAHNNGKGIVASYMWPLLIDGGLIIFSLAVVYKSLRNERAIVQWFAVVLFTVATVLFNVFQESHTVTRYFVLGSAPVVLFATFETLMSMIRGRVKRTEYHQNITELDKIRQESRQEVEKLQRTIKRLERKEERAVETTTPQQLETSASELSSRQTRIVGMVESGQSNKSQIARELGIARTTVYSELDTLKELGVLSENGNGLQIVGGL